MVVLLALLAALLFALAAAAEQRAAARLVRPPAAARCCAAARCPKAARARARAKRVDLTGRRVRKWTHLAIGLVLSPLWLAGWAADAMGFGAQAAALHVGSLSVVQPLLVTTLLFSLPLAALGSRRSPRWTDWTGGVVVCVGLALVLAGRHVGSGAALHEGRLFMAILLSLAVAGGLVLSALGPRARGRAVTLSVAAGMMFSLGAVFTKLVTDRLADGGVVGVLVYWPAYALIVISLLGLVLQQSAFSVGSLPATMTAITIIDPLLSYVLGVVGFGEAAPRGAAAGLAVLGLGLLAAGVVVLARSPLLQAPGTPTVPSPSEPLPRTGVVHAPAAEHIRVRDGNVRVLNGTGSGNGARAYHAGLGLRAHERPPAHDREAGPRREAAPEGVRLAACMPPPGDEHRSLPLPPIGLVSPVAATPPALPPL